jgi:hypothetical protein
MNKFGGLISIDRSRTARKNALVPVIGEGKAMSTSLKPLLPAALLLGALGLSACSSPASEEPVALRNGLYTFTANGAFATGKPITEICLSGGDDQRKINKLIKGAFALYEECSHQPEARVGNAVSGKLTCEIDETAGMNTIYKGSVTAESLALDVTIETYAPDEKTSVDGAFIAKRSGDCS